MKRIYILVPALLFCLSACTGRQGEGAQNGGQDTQAAQPENVRTVPQSVRAADDILKSIAGNYKGRVALIDFWATWCGPCWRAMAAVDELKKEMAARGVAFVYVTGETSPASDWQQATGRISGDHFRLTETQWEELGQALRMRGIPAYMLLNKDGTVAYSNVQEGGYPGTEILRERIEAALSK